MSTPTTLTVTQVGELVKGIIDSNNLLGGLFVKGEISNFTNHAKTGHFYFTLKDEGATLTSIMFKGHAGKLAFVPQNGMKVIARGRISAYVKGGNYQMYVEDLTPDGVGALHIAYEQLKAKLAAEGLFDTSAKRAIPKIPSCVALVTSPTGAAVRDMINVLTRRFPYAKILLYPCLVQGENAAASIAEGVRTISEKKLADVMIVGRGGGSIEDLWAFNDEQLARTIRASAVPVISAVGHETDFTIADFVADLRAPTPSAAAELAVPVAAELVRKINNITTHSQLLLDRAITARREQLARLSSSRVLQNPLDYIDERRLHLLALERQLAASTSTKVATKRTDFALLASSLEALSPLNVLGRGYAAVFDERGEVVQSVEQVQVDDMLNFKLKDGNVTTKVVDKESNHGK